MGEFPEQPNPQLATPIRAALYARMSTDHQQYSIDNQVDTMREYARKHGMEVVQTFADEGKSGLRLDGRDALKDLIRGVQDGQPGFDVILVYDVSRWGRFQDADESAYYEYLCKKAGIAVIYCAEQFENDGSPIATIVKGVKRAMAGEYSRELSSKVFQGQCRLVQLGYHQGGLAGYGLRRLLVDQSGQMKGELKIGEQKSIQTDRVILMPGPPEEVETVRWIFKAFALEQKDEREIAGILNVRGIKTDLDRPWTRTTVHQVLTNEKYIGNNVYNRISFKLKKRRVCNPPDMWIRADQAFTPVVEKNIFASVQDIIQARSRHLTDQELLNNLRDLYEKHGRLSAIIIDEEDGPSSSAYRNRFGSLVRAYHLIGYEVEHDYEYLEINRRLREMHPQIVTMVIREIEKLGGDVCYEEETGIITLFNEVCLSLILARCCKTAGGRLRWTIRLERQDEIDITIAVRMDPSNSDILDFYLLPGIDLHSDRLRFAENNGIFLDAYRFDTLDYLYSLTLRTRIEAVA